MSRRPDDNNEHGQGAALSRLRDKRFNGYLRIRLPHELDIEVEAIVAAYRHGSTPVRQKMTGSVDRRAAGILSAYGQRMASTAVRAHDAVPLIGTTLQTVLADVARVLPQADLTAIQKFDQRQDRDKSLESMGLRRTGSGQTFLFE